MKSFILLIAISCIAANPPKKGKKEKTGRSSTSSSSALSSIFSSTSGSSSGSSSSKSTSNKLHKSKKNIKKKSKKPLRNKSPHRKRNTSPKRRKRGVALLPIDKKVKHRRRSNKAVKGSRSGSTSGDPLIPVRRSSSVHSLNSLPPKRKVIRPKDQKKIQMRVVTNLMDMMRYNAGVPIPDYKNRPKILDRSTVRMMFFTSLGLILLLIPLMIYDLIMQKRQKAIPINENGDCETCTHDVRKQMSDFKNKRGENVGTLADWEAMIDKIKEKVKECDHETPQ